MVASKYDIPEVCKKTFQPIGNLVAVQVHRITRSEEGLQLPDGSTDARQFVTATVIACGPECKFTKEGDLVLMVDSVPGAKGKHGDSGTQVFIQENNLLAVSLVKGRGASDEERWAASGGSKATTLTADDIKKMLRMFEEQDSQPNETL